MRKILIKILAAGIASTVSIPVHACSKPEAVNIADGARASIEEMNANQLLVINYLTAMDAYLKCLASEPAPAGLNLAGDSARQRKKLRDEAIAAKEKIAAQFNEQVRVFKDANP